MILLGPFKILKQNVSFFIQPVVLNDDCCMSQNVGRTEINFVTSNNCIFHSLNNDINIDLQVIN